MIRLKDAIDEKTLVILQEMFMQFLHSSSALYEVDGEAVYSVFEGHYCSLLNRVSCKNAGCCEKEAMDSGKWICHEECWRISRESMDEQKPLERECSGGINIYAVPIIYKGQVIGSINAGVTSPPLERCKLEAVASCYGTEIDLLVQHAYAYKRLTNEEMEIARMQIRMASLLISSLYETKVRQLEAEEEIRCQNELIKEKSLIVEEQKKQLEAIMENMSESLFIFDKSGKYILINKEGRMLFGGDIPKHGDSYKFVEYYDLEGNKIPFEDTPNYHALLGTAVAEKVMLMKSPIEEIYVSVSSSPIFDEKGDLIYGVVTGRNVTEKVKYEQTIKKQQELLLKAVKEKNDALENAIKMKDEFLATITHEFKTPLTVINAALQTIESLYGSQISDNVKRHLQRIRTNTFRQLRLVNNLLDITRYHAGHFKVNNRNLDIVFLSNAIVKSVDLYAKQKGVEVRFLSDCKYREIAIDEEKYERILLNLLSNAIKFTPKGKSIYVCISCKGQKAVITVNDEGIGIPKDKQNWVFERFGQVDSSLSRQAEGTGIGLSLVKTLVEGMNGTIFLDSEIGKGSTFTITLPMKRLRRNKAETKIEAPQDSRIIQAAEIEFSDIYLE